MKTEFDIVENDLEDLKADVDEFLVELRRGVEKRTQKPFQYDGVKFNFSLVGMDYEKFKSAEQKAVCFIEFDGFLSPLKEEDMLFAWENYNTVVKQVQKQISECAPRPYEMLRV